MDENIAKQEKEEATSSLHVERVEALLDEAFNKASSLHRLLTKIERTVK